MTQKTPSIWDYKPWWCQPWSIILTSILLISGSWVLLSKLWVTILVAIPVLTWMIYFVVIFPKQAIATLEKDPN
ncbi:DUF6737 family protein [Synechocystis sp. PCC 7509]|uniref:DUF6737 family protein n=1 Tax=Synechocystis sp. PCC 7509 TaxID=927677 RepID=UPI0002ABBE06|nr:DUF6737 family protein [Synechocystis sp. PCC 7509]